MQEEAERVDAILLGKEKVISGNPVSVKNS